MLHGVAVAVKRYPLDSFTVSGISEWRDSIDTVEIGLKAAVSTIPPASFVKCHAVLRHVVVILIRGGKFSAFVEAETVT